MNSRHEQTLRFVEAPQGVIVQVWRTDANGFDRLEATYYRLRLHDLGAPKVTEDDIRRLLLESGLIDG